MAINYLEGNEQRSDAIQNIGRTFSDAVIGMRNAKLNQRMAIQNALVKAAQLDLQRQKFQSNEGLQQKKFGEQQLVNKSTIDKNTAAAGLSGEKQKELQAKQKIMQRLGPLAAARGMTPDQLSQQIQNPKDAQRMYEMLTQSGAAPTTEKGPVQGFYPSFMNPNKLGERVRLAQDSTQQSIVGTSPTATEKMMQAYSPPPMSPAQESKNKIDKEKADTSRDASQIKSVMEVAGGDKDAMGRIPKGVYEDLAPIISGYIQRLRQQQGGARNPQGIPYGIGLAPGQGQTPPSAQVASNQNEEQKFADEDAARQSGAKAGDIIYIQGVGKVRLK